MAQPSDIKPIIPELSMQSGDPSLAPPAPVQVPPMPTQDVGSLAAQPALQAAPEPSFDLSYLDEPQAFDLSYLDDPAAGGMIEEAAGPSPGASAWATIKAGLGRDAKEQEMIFANHYGADNVKVSGNRILFREPGEKKFRSVKPDDLSALSGLFQSLMENSGNILESAVGVAPEAAMLAAVAGTAGAAAPGVLGLRAAGGILGGATMGGGLGASARQSAVAAATGGQLSDEVSLLDESLKGASNNLIAASVMVPAQIAGSMILRGARDSAMNRLYKINNVNEGLEGLFRAYGVQDAASKSSETVNNTLLKERSFIGAEIGLTREAAHEAAGDAKFPVTDYVQTLQSKLKDHTLGGSGATEDAVYQKASSMFRDMENIITKDGGSTVQHVDNLLARIDDMSGFGKPFGTKTDEELFFSQVGNSLRKDRDRIYEQVLAGTPEGQNLRSTFDNYSKSIEPLNSFLNEYIDLSKTRVGATDEFASSIIKKGGVDRVKQFKSLLNGANREDAWNTVKGEYLRDIFDKSKTVDNIPDGGKILKEINALGNEVKKEVFSAQELKQIYKLANDVRKIYKGDLSPESFVNEINASKWTSANPMHWLQMGLDAASGRPQAMDYLMGEGLVKLKASNADKSGLLNRMRQMTEIVPPKIKGSGKAGAAVNAARFLRDTTRNATTRSVRDSMSSPAPDLSYTDEYPQSE